MEANRGWADLPKELVEMIRERLESRVDVLRLRSVCSTWRSSVAPPSFQADSPPVTLTHPRSSRVSSVVTEAAICRIQLKHPKGLLTKVVESTKGQLRLLHALYQFRHKRGGPLSLSLDNTSFIQVARSVSLVKPPWCWARRIVLLPVTARLSDPDFAVIAIYDEGRLGYWKRGEWRLLDESNFQYDDVAVRNGQYYVVDRVGTVSWIDGNLNVVQYSPPLFGCGGRKSLVESRGELYVVDRYLEEERVLEGYDDVVREMELYNYDHRWVQRRRRQWKGCNARAVDLRVYRLDEEWGRWVDVRSLGDRSFVLAGDCSFSVDARELFRGKGNCIYFTEEEGGESSGREYCWESVKVFELGDGVIEKFGLLPEHSEMFWPPPPPAAAPPGDVHQLLMDQTTSSPE